MSGQVWFGVKLLFCIVNIATIRPSSGEISTLVICHTRENWPTKSVTKYARFSKYMPDVKTDVFYGGTPIKRDIEKLKNKDTCPHIVVATQVDYML